jgi:serine/threonine protein kinase
MPRTSSTHVDFPKRQKLTHNSQGTDKKTNKQVAIKLEEVGQEVSSPCRRLETVKLEGRLYRKLPPHSYPKLHWTGTTRGGLYDALVTDLLGPSLGNLWEYCRYSFTLDTLCNVAIQALKRLQGLHKKGIIHNDIKPTNFAMGSGKNGNTLYLIDYGLSTTFEEIKHKEEVKETGGLLGTAYYAPLEALRGRSMTSQRLERLMRGRKRKDGRANSFFP